MPFWENVYGFDMSSIGKELVEDAAHIPIVDVVDGNNLVTNTALLKVGLHLYFVKRPKYPR